LLIAAFLALTAPSAYAADLTLSPEVHNSHSARERVQQRPASYEYTVRAGDTLWDIAIAHGITLPELQAANPGLDAGSLHAGQQIQVPAPPPAEPAAPAALDPPADPQSEEAQAPDTGAVQPASPETSTSPAGVAPELAEWPAAIMAVINSERAARGLRELVWSESLAQAAQAHAEDCAGRNRGSHTGSDGASLSERLARAGYAPLSASENWANARSPQHAFLMWWNEPANGPHRRNILDADYTEIGIGVARGSWGLYFVADFASR
jgi:uncharacterized protein YkwD